MARLGWAWLGDSSLALALAVAPLLCAYIKGAFRPLSRRPTWTNVHPYSTPSSGHVTPPVTTPARHAEIQRCHPKAERSPVPRLRYPSTCALIEPSQTAEPRQLYRRLGI
ncbi:uncharacterized protein TrAtP1_000123 [Trichoderma atroviride]|uniref:uncharacterized protein n=1 Tax=Hypocrea atroviridis TaxID=63577 RepID=UPI0033311798|nr:hypothetical protein TrAtP1_000123 [Trichoderma atroviride]